MIRRQPVTAQTLAAQAPEVAGQHFPFSLEFQGMLLKMLLEDREFSAGVAEHIQPAYFQAPVHRWGWHTALAFRGRYGGFPTIGHLISSAQQVTDGQRDVLVAALDGLRSVVVTDSEALRDQTLDFVRRCIFRQAVIDGRDLFNGGKFDAAYDLMRERMDQISGVTWRTARRAWLGEGFIDRHIQRQDASQDTRQVVTGIPALDLVLEGGLRPGELGAWIAYPKHGKTTLLINLGAAAVRIQHKRVLHCVLEGGIQYVMDRYDTIFTSEAYSAVKRGDIDAAKYARAVQELSALKRCMVVRDFTEGWDANATHLDEELKALRQVHGWEPDLIVVDYLDLLRGRKRDYASETSEQKDAAKDIKTLADRGYAVWTASQVQRPKSTDFDTVPHLLYSRDIADAYAKVRIASFIGSINQTLQEREQQTMRLFAELYRDGESHRVIEVKTDFRHMTITGRPGDRGQSVTAPTPDASVQRDVPFGYGNLRQVQVGEARTGGR